MKVCIKYTVLIIFIILLLTGCKDNSLDDNKEVFSYLENSLVLRVPESKYPFRLIGADNTHFFFYNSSTVEMFAENEAEEIVEFQEKYTFFMQKLEPQSNPQELNISIEGMRPIDCEFFEDKEGKRRLNCLLYQFVDGNDIFLLNSYKLDGELLNSIIIPSPDISDNYPRRIKEIENGGYAVLFQKSLIILDAEGEEVSCTMCPEDEYRGLEVSENGTVYTTFADMDSERVYLASKSFDEKNFQKKCEIKGDGNYLYISPEKVSLIADGYICQYSPLLEEDSYVEMVDLKKHNISSNQYAAFGIQDGNIWVLGYSTDIMAVRMITLVPSDNYENKDAEKDKIVSEEKGRPYDDYGRRILYLYDYSGNWPQDSTNPIDAFNEQSTNYQVVFKEFDYDDEYGLTKMIASGEMPDLIYSPYNKFVESMLEKKILEDITPYLQKSEKLSLNKLMPEVVNAYTIDGQLFALPNYFSIKTLAGPKDSLGEPGWTVDEFLNWLAEYEGEARMVGTRTAIYEACLPALLEMCIDIEQGVSDFDSEVFRNFLKKTKALNRKEVYTKEDIKVLSGYEEPIFDGFSNLGRIAVEEKQQGCDIIIKGYPSEDGKPACYINSSALSIVSTGDAKEGAYEFLEFYMLYQNQTIEQSSLYGGAKLWTVQEYFDRTREALLQSESYMGEPCTYSEEQLNEVADILPYIKLENYAMEELSNLIWEEITPYFENQRDLDMVCEVVQNKVQLYLDEKH